eukprot:m.113879 g.113879  ORF g.113879 m.113879 type:complete len:290 (-) comp16014_c1_seq1:1880-2749(-)
MSAKRVKHTDGKGKAKGHVDEDGDHDGHDGHDSYNDLRLCHERIIPDDLDPERYARHILAAQLSEASPPKELSAAGPILPARMAVVITKKWPPKQVLRCRFLDGSPTMQKKVKEVAVQWMKYVSVKIQFVAAGPAEIRISFYADAGSWSAVGRDALNTAYFPLHQPTMNYGWLRDTTPDDEYQRVVLHEFGHALGAIHEHQSPNFSRVWDVPQVMKYFSGPPNYWSPEDIHHNVLDKYSPKGLAVTRYDPNSIMLYMFDGKLFADHKGPTNENKTLSDSDKTFMRSMYP